MSGDGAVGHNLASADTHFSGAAKPRTVLDDLPLFRYRSSLPRREVFSEPNILTMSRDICDFLGLRSPPSTVFRLNSTNCSIDRYLVRLSGNSQHVSARFSGSSANRFLFFMPKTNLEFCGSQLKP